MTDMHILWIVIAMAAGTAITEISPVFPVPTGQRDAQIRGVPGPYASLCHDGASCGLLPERNRNPELALRTP